jgi:hypothetical protein
VSTIQHEDILFKWNKRLKSWQETTHENSPVPHPVGPNGLDRRCKVEVRPHGDGLPIWLENIDDERWEGVDIEGQRLSVKHTELCTMVADGQAGSGDLLGVSSSSPRED